MSVVYSCTNRLAAWHGITWAIPIVDGIDGRFLWRWTIIPYVAFYPMVAWALIRPKRASEQITDRLIVLEGVWTLTLWSNIIFLFAPSNVPITELVDASWRDSGSLVGGLWQFLAWADEPTNGFPSLHVSIILFLAIEGTQRPGQSQRLLMMWIATALIIISTMTTGQHQILDVFGGVALAVLASKYILPSPEQDIETI